MVVLKENERMLREDGNGPQLLIAAGDGKRGRNRGKGDYSGRSNLVAHSLSRA